jgi:transcriptional regulator with XRE-family HTH domain
MTAIEFRDCLAQLGLTQTDAARLLEVDPRTVRRWAEGNAADIPGPAVQALRAWLGLQRRGLPWRPGDGTAEQIAPHRAHAIELYELLLRVDKRGGPSDAWNVDVERGQATLGPVKVWFYKLTNGGFSPSYYSRSDGHPDFKRDWPLIEDAFACIAKAFAEQQRIKFVFAVTLQAPHVLLWDVQKVPTIVLKVPCAAIRRALCRDIPVTDEQCRLLIDCNKSLICEVAEMMYAAKRFETRGDRIRVMDVTVSDLTSIADRFSLTVLEITPIWIGAVDSRQGRRRGSAEA